jgi:hypothetical protein
VFAHWDEINLALGKYFPAKENYGNYFSAKENYEIKS